MLGCSTGNDQSWPKAVGPLSAAGMMERTFTPALTSSDDEEGRRLRMSAERQYRQGEQTSD
jgi:hypothetical protein